MCMGLGQAHWTPHPHRALPSSSALISSDGSGPGVRTAFPFHQNLKAFLPGSSFRRKLAPYEKKTKKTNRRGLVPRRS
jgi:hypothetical protein